MRCRVRVGEEINNNEPPKSMISWKGHNLCIHSGSISRGIPYTTHHQDDMKFSLFVACLAVILPSAYAGYINLCANLPNGDAATGVHVNCRDYDPVDADDFMASGTIDETGCVSLYYPRLDYPWYQCYKEWDSCANNDPDIYCEIGAPGDCITPITTATANSQNSGSTTNMGTFTVEENENFCSDASFNGCGPSFLPTFLIEILTDVSGFVNECNDHDVCYQDCTQLRSHCDNEFKYDMYAQCDQVQDGLCDFLADAYYTAVDLAGEDACIGGRDHCTTAEQNLCSA